jgi:hypothetical protein
MKHLRLLGILVILLGLVAIPAYAEPDAPPGNWVTDFTVLNLENKTATVQVTRYNQCSGNNCPADTGTTVASPTIAPNGSWYYNPATDPNFPAGFTGSIVLSSDALLGVTATTANDRTGTQYASDAYAGVSDVSTDVFLPIIMGKLGAWNTRMAIQNAGGAAANITIDYIGAGAPGDTVITNVPPNMTVIVDQFSNAGMNNFNGSARVTSNQPLAVEVDEYRSTGGVLISYVGVPVAQAATTLYMPGFIATGVWATDFTIVNTEGTPANVQMTFSGSPATLSGQIPANGSAYVNGYAGVKPGGWTGMPPVSGYYGSAKITSDKKVVVVYNIANAANGGAGNYQMGYVGFSSGSNKVAVPLIENKFSSGWDTTFSVQNIGGGTADLSMVYSGNKAPLCNPCTKQIQEAWTFNQTTDNHVPTGFLGGVTISSTKPIVVIADQNKTGATGDTQAGYPGVVVP